MPCIHQVSLTQYSLCRKHPGDTLCCPFRKAAWEECCGFFTAKLWELCLKSLNIIGEAFRNSQPYSNPSLFKTSDKISNANCGSVKIPKLCPQLCSCRLPFLYWCYHHCCIIIPFYMWFVIMAAETTHYCECISLGIDEGNNSMVHDNILLLLQPVNGRARNCSRASWAPLLSLTRGFILYIALCWRKTFTFLTYWLILSPFCPQVSNSLQFW